MRNFYLFGLLMLSGIVNAQVPGYMGKRFSLFLEGNPTPALFVMNANNEVCATMGESSRTSKTNRFAYNFRPQATVEYLVGRDFSVGISYSRIAMGTIRAYDKNDNTQTFDTDLDVIKGQAAGVHLKFYQFNKSASIAPIGFYKTLSLYITQINTYDTKKSKVKQFKNDFIYPVATFSVGRQTMLVKGLLLKTGVELGWAFVPANFMKELDSDWTIQEYSGYQVHQSLFGNYIFSMNVALGYTLF
jgi:hypothetical protein